MSGGQGKHPGSDALRQWQALQLSKIELELQQQALYRQLFELSPACSYALDAAGRVVCVNQAGAR